MEKNAFTLMRAVFIIIIVSSHSWLFPFLDDTRGNITTVAVIGFFVLAGFFSWKGIHERPYADFAIEKIKRLYVPLVFVAALSFFLIPTLLNILFFDLNPPRIILNNNIDVSSEIQRFVFFIAYTDTTHLWFIYALLVIFLGFPILLRIFGIWGDAVSLLILFSISVLAKFENPGGEPFYYIIIAYILFFYVGYLVHKNKVGIKKLAVFWGPIALALFVSSIVFIAYLEDATLSSAVLAIGACAGIFSSYWLCSIAETLLVRKGVAALGVLYYIGENSYGIYLLHQPYFYLKFLFSKIAVIYPELVVLCFILSVVAGIVLPIAFLNLLSHIRGIVLARRGER